MKERIKSFFVFTSTGYRILAFLVLPVFGIVLGHLVAFLLAIPGYFVTIFFLMPLELILDFMVFGGICAKEVSHLEYLKGSARGKWVIKNALVGGMLQTLLILAVVIVGNHISYQILFPAQTVGTDAILIPGALLISAYAVTMGMVIVGRFFDNLNVYYLLAVVAAAVEGSVLQFLVLYRYPTIMISVILAVILSMLSVKIALKTIEESYYDKTVADGN